MGVAENAKDHVNQNATKAKGKKKINRTIKSAL